MIVAGNTLCKVVTKFDTTPYIEGHITNDATSISFIVNGNTTITVDVDNNGKWKWVVNIPLSGLQRAFQSVYNIDYVSICNVDGITNLSQMFANPSQKRLPPLKVYFKNCDLSNCTSCDIMFQHNNGLQEFNVDNNSLSPTSCDSMFLNCNILQNVSPYFFKNATNLKGTLRGCLSIKYADFGMNKVAENISNLMNVYGQIIKVKMCSINTNITSDGQVFPMYLEDLSFENDGYVKSSISLYNCQYLTKKSILNLINAAAANVTYTLHSTIYDKCASSGEWYTEVQAAIDAKALEGYTVTLISA